MTEQAAAAPKPKRAMRVLEEKITGILEPLVAELEISVEDALDKLIQIGWSRWKALRSYGGKAVPKVPRAKKSDRPKAAKKKVTKKAAKKRPLAEATGAPASEPAPVASPALPSEGLDDDFGPPPKPASLEPEPAAVEQATSEGMPEAPLDPDYDPFDLG